jgi:hypothetical protein
MSTPAPLQGVTWPLWLVFLCLTPPRVSVPGPLLKSLCLCRPLPFSLWYENAKHRPGSSESQSNIAPQGWVRAFIY